MLLLIFEIIIGESSSRAPYKLQKDQPWKAEVNAISTEAGKVSDFGGQTASFALSK